VHKLVKEAYAKAATTKTSSCCGAGAKKTKAQPCCAAGRGEGSPSDVLLPSQDFGTAAQKMGYSEEEVRDAPEEANLGLGCGAPLKAAAVKAGDTVLDLGSGAGFDAFLSSRVVGPEGKVIGVDMTEEMIAKAKANAVKGGYTNVDFRLGKIEALPVDDNTVDKIISNCVINLSPDKQAVFREAHRVLKPGGRLAVSDICLTQKLPKSVEKSLTAYVGCIAGASLIDDYVGMMRQAGFVKIDITKRRAFDVLACGDPIVLEMIEGLKDDKEVNIEDLKDTVVSATVVAYKE